MVNKSISETNNHCQQTHKVKIDCILESTINSHRGAQKYYSLSSAAKKCAMKT